MYLCAVRVLFLLKQGGASPMPSGVGVGKQVQHCERTSDALTIWFRPLLRVVYADGVVVGCCRGASEEAGELT